MRLLAYRKALRIPNRELRARAVGKDRVIELNAAQCRAFLGRGGSIFAVEIDDGTVEQVYLPKFYLGAKSVQDGRTYTLDVIDDECFSRRGDNVRTQMAFITESGELLIRGLTRDQLIRKPKIAKTLRFPNEGLFRGPNTVGDLLYEYDPSRILTKIDHFDPIYATTEKSRRAARYDNAVQSAKLWMMWLVLAAVVLLIIWRLIQWLRI